MKMIIPHFDQLANWLTSLTGGLFTSQYSFHLYQIHCLCVVSMVTFIPK